MRLVIYALLTMTAFAANSVVNRYALVQDAIDPASFAIVRLFAGTLVLSVLVAAQRASWKIGSKWRPVSAAALAIYMVAVSLAFASLSVHVGALILFGGVQLILFLSAVAGRRKFSSWQWLGVLLAAGGLAWLVRPGAATEIDLTAAGLMAAAALAWAVYSLIERNSDDLLGSGAANFAFAAPLSLLGLFFADFSISPIGVGLALLSGIVTTGFGFALWFAILPKLRMSNASLAQLCVPILSAYGGVIVLGERLDLHFIIAAVLVIGGMAFSIASRPQPAGDPAR